jgi:hypothetical protein
MSGPIVRTGTTPKFWQNYDRIFSGTASKKAVAPKKDAAKSEAKAETKTVKKTVKKAASKKKT